MSVYLSCYCSKKGIGSVVSIKRIWYGAPPSTHPGTEKKQNMEHNAPCRLLASHNSLHKDHVKEPKTAQQQGLQKLLAIELQRTLICFNGLSFHQSHLISLQ